MNRWKVWRHDESGQILKETLHAIARDDSLSLEEKADRYVATYSSHPQHEQEGYLKKLTRTDLMVLKVMSFIKKEELEKKIAADDFQTRDDHTKILADLRLVEQMITEIGVAEKFLFTDSFKRI